LPNSNFVQPSQSGDRNQLCGCIYPVAERKEAIDFGRPASPKMIGGEKLVPLPVRSSPTAVQGPQAGLRKKGQTLMEMAPESHVSQINYFAIQETYTLLGRQAQIGAILSEKVALFRTLGTSYYWLIQSFNPRKVLNPSKKADDRSKIEILSSSYIFREPDEVYRLLSSNKTLITLVTSAYKKIREEFPSEKIFLEAVSDPPFSSEKDVVISVSTSLPVDKAIERLDKVDNVRWDKDSKDPYVDICVKLEYQ